MKLIAGLGNYPKEYNLTRHNAGFIAVNYIQEHNNFEDWNESKKFLCDISKGELFNQDVILIKPNTYMNLSGDSVIKVMNFYKLKAEDLIVLHDELDFNFGVVKVSQSRNSAGHNGIKSINSYVKEQYNRIRIGIGRPENKDYDISNYVLSKFTKEEQEKLDEISKNVVLTIKTLI